MVSSLSRALKVRTYQPVAFRHAVHRLNAPHGYLWVPKDVNTVFKSKFSASSVSCRPSGVHQTMITEILHSLRSALPPDPENRLTIGQNQPVVGFKGKYILSKPCPDLMLQYRNNQLQNETLLALELGFTEGYPELKQSMKLWIEGTESAPIVILIKVKESPRHANPLLKPGWERGLTAELPSLASLKQEDIRPMDPNDPSSPLLMYGLRFSGRLTAYIEIWVRNKDGKAELLETRDIYDRYRTSSTLEIPLSQFIPRTFDVEGKKWILKSQDITKGTENQREILAYQRCWSAVKAKETRDI